MMRNEKRNVSDLFGTRDFFVQRPIDVSGTADAEWLSGTMYADRIEGRGGDDVLAGGAGSDTYVYTIGDGAVTILDEFGDANVLSFGIGIEASGIAPLLADGMLTLDIGNGDSIALGALTDIAIQTLRFADASTQTLETLLAQRGVVQPLGTAGDDVMAIFGSELPLLGLSGNGSVSIKSRRWRDGEREANRPATSDAEERIVA